MTAALLALLLAAAAIWSLGVGAAPIPARAVLLALADPAGDSREALVIWTVRLPRLLAAIGAGAALAAAGAIMQAVTGNALADPGLLGVNAGAAFAVVAAITLAGPASSSGGLVWAAFLGAALAAAAVYALGAAGRSGATPVRLVLAGVVIGTFLGVVTMTLLLVDAQTLDTVRFWTAGSLRGRALADVLAVLPHAGVGLLLALLLRGAFTTLSLGGDVAQGLGQNPALWRGIAALVVVLLAGSAVAMAGPLGFVGLVVPHLARLTHGADYRRILPLCALGGALLTLLADVLPRALWSTDVPAGISLALIGAPFFIWLARRQGAVPT